MEPIRQTLHDFWSSFGVPAYNDTIVTDHNGREPPELPYITYNISTPDALSSTAISANIWDKNTSFRRIDGIKKLISDRIPIVTGITLKSGSGYIRLFRNTSNFFFDVVDDDPTIRHVVVSIILRNISVWE